MQDAVLMLGFAAASVLAAVSIGIELGARRAYADMRYQQFRTMYRKEKAVECAIARRGREV